MTTFAKRPRKRPSSKACGNERKGSSTALTRSWDVPVVGYKEKLRPPFSGKETQLRVGGKPPGEGLTTPVGRIMHQKREVPLVSSFGLAVSRAIEAALVRARRKRELSRSIVAKKPQEPC
ncbi:hypothetical protein MPNT_300007 [Candidatus Methylacidithermus pantelleriae]|uniref:Uncharacterized protein n=1 Tax=Candidatus Methylacidithermus pantelleriae TaxID=2744239 RepID=A0A8J2BJA4_9BACT|nr:hypothetical protein MPNT_300007 [Candidatus Methylacidithermus pantelleriae]